MNGLFSSITLAVLIASTAVVAVHLLLVRPWRWRADARGPRRVRRYGRFARLVHLVTLGSFLVLTVTGFAPALLGRPRLAGYWLLVHVAFGPVFATGLAAMALLWAHDSRFLACDAQWLRGGGLWRPGRPAGRFDAAQKTFFWLALALGWSTLATVMLSMLAWLPSQRLGVLHEVHRYSALALLAAVLVHLYRQTLARPGAWRAMVGGGVTVQWARRHHPLWRPQDTGADSGDENEQTCGDGASGSGA